MLEINEPNRDMLAIFPEGHTVFAVEPCGKLFVSPHQSFALNGEEDCPEFVDDLIRSSWVFGNFRVDFFEGFNEL